MAVYKIYIAHEPLIVVYGLFMAAVMNKTSQELKIQEYH